MLRTSVTILAWLLGFFPVSNPFRKLRNLQWIVLHPIMFWSVFLAFFPTVLHLDMFHDHGLVKGPNPHSLVKQLRSVLNFINADVPHLIIRCTAVWCCAGTAQLFKDIETIKEWLRSHDAYDRKRLPYKGRGYLLWGMFLFAVAVVMYFTVSRFIMMKTLIQLGHYPDWDLGPKIMEVQLGVTLLLDLAGNTAPAFAILFVGVVGLDLIQVHWCVTQLLGVIEVRSGKLNPVGVASVSSFGNDHPVQMKLEKFQLLMQAFRSYNSIAGWYRLALVVLMGTGLLKSFTEPIAEGVMQTAALVEAASMLFCTWILGGLGDFMESKFRGHHEGLLLKLCSTGAESKPNDFAISPWVALISGTKFVATARDLFDVNSKLIPALLGSVLTYIIVVIQLVKAELGDLEATGPIQSSTYDDLK